MKSRTECLLPGGVPRYIRCYDNGGESFDRYTVVFTGRYKHKTGGAFWYVGMSDNPFHPQGFGQHGESTDNQIDWPTYGHLGKKIKFQDLPEDCQKLVQDNYRYLWDLCAVCGASPAPFKDTYQEAVYCQEHRPQEVKYFFECGGCDQYHPLGFTGDCRDDANRYHIDFEENMRNENGKGVRLFLYEIVDEDFQETA